MTTYSTISTSARLPADLARELERTSREDDRSQNMQLVHLLRIGLAGRERLKQFEQQSAALIAKQQAPNLPYA